MPTFIDESGDPGFKPGRSDFFMLCAVTLPSAKLAEEMRQAIRQLKIELKMPAGQEFKFSETGSSPKRREAFFDLCLRYPWRFAGAAVEKRHISHGDQSNATCFQVTSHAIADTLCPEFESRWLADPGGYRKEAVTVDDNKDRIYLAAVSGAFRPLGRSGNPAVILVGKVKFDDGRSEVLLQLADMLCGAIADSLGGNDTWLNRVKSRQLSTTWCLPGGG